MKFKQVREAAFEQWMKGTSRQRINEHDNIEQIYECNWQLKYQAPDKAGPDHYSIFCSMGEWNTIITDYLSDERWDALDYDVEEDRDKILRQYTKVLLAISEILTDFQDLLITFMLAKRPSTDELKKGAKQARTMLEGLNAPETIFKIFNYINNVCKHKCNNIHVCNHHLHLFFEDSGSANASQASIDLDNLADYVGKSSSEAADTLVVPQLGFFIQIMLNGYKVIDIEFRAIPAQFEALCELFKGKSCRA